jgi:hypothetical protein
VAQSLLSRTKNFVQSFLQRWSPQGVLESSLEIACGRGAVTSLHGSNTVDDAVAVMSSEHVSAIIVRDIHTGDINGIFTERDLYAGAVCTVALPRC